MKNNRISVLISFVICKSKIKNRITYWSLRLVEGEEVPLEGQLFCGLETKSDIVSFPKDSAYTFLLPKLENSRLVKTFNIYFYFSVVVDQASFNSYGLLLVVRNPLIVVVLPIPPEHNTLYRSNFWVGKLDVSTFVYKCCWYGIGPSP